jgi:hypothetical protein
MPDLIFGVEIMSWRAGAALFRDMWPLIQVHVPYGEDRAEFLRDLLHFFTNCDMDGADLRGLHPEIDAALNELDASAG